MKGGLNVEKKGHCRLESSASTWKKSHFCLKEGRFTYTQWTPHNSMRLEFYPFHRFQMLCRTHSVRVKIICYWKYTHQHCHWHLWPSKFVDFHWSFWRLDKTLHLKPPYNDTLISTIYLHRQHEQQHLIYFWFLLQLLYQWGYQRLSEPQICWSHIPVSCL